MKYYTIVTEVGTDLIAQAAVQGKKVNITHFAVGDGNGNYYEPNTSMTALKREKWRGEVSKYEIDKLSPNIIKVSAIIPQNIGGFTMREMGLFDNENRLIAVCNTPDLVKVILEDGISTEVEVSMRIAVTNTDIIQFNVDPTVIMATKKDIENAIDIHSVDENVHKNLFDLKADKNLSNVTQQTIINKINSTGNGNTLNADTVDGKHSNEFTQYLGYLTEEIFTDYKYRINYEGNINGISTDISGLPDASYYNIKYFRHANPSGYGIQIAIPYSSHTAKILNNIYWRISTSTSWGDWKCMSDGGNADTLDDIHASGFIQYKRQIPEEIFTDYNYSIGYEGVIYGINTDVSGLPDDKWYKIKFMPHINGDGNSTQIAISYGIHEDENKGIYWRNGNTKSWGDWQVINDGGNADMVDGKHAADLQNYNNLTNKPASLPANGGNADTLDDKHANDFTQYLGQISEEIFTNCNYRVNYEGAINGISTDVSGLPDTGYYKIKYFQHITSNGHGTQIAIPYSTHTTKVLNSIYWRTASSTVWSDWKCIGDSGNADTVDGKHASDLQNYNNLTNKPASLPANGGNADTLDGKSSNRFTQWLASLTEEIFTDYNYKINYEGVISGIDTNVSGLPDTGWYQIIYFQHIHGNGYGTQIAIPYASHTSGVEDIYWRKAGGTSWNEWKKINDGGNAKTIEGYSVSALLDYFKEEVSVIKSIQRGVVDGGGTITISKVDVNKTIVILNSSIYINNVHTTRGARLIGITSTSITLAEVDQTHSSWQVIEFN